MVRSGSTFITRSRILPRRLRTDPPQGGEREKEKEMEMEKEKEKEGNR